MRGMPGRRTTGVPGAAFWRTRRTKLALRLRRLRRIGAKQAILQRRTVEPADDRIHLLGIWRFDEREALGLLRFGVADHLNRVRDQVFGCQASP